MSRNTNRYLFSLEKGSWIWAIEFESLTNPHFQTLIIPRSGKASKNSLTPDGALLSLRQISHDTGAGARRDTGESGVSRPF